MFREIAHWTKREYAAADERDSYMESGPADSPARSRRTLAASFASVLVLLCTNGQPLWPQAIRTEKAGNNSSSVQEHIRELISSLPARSQIRKVLEKGARGDGVHYAWMDKMREEGVKRVLVRTEFIWHSRPTEIHVTRIVYFSKYDSDCGQISDPEWLARIRASGLEDELGKVAIQHTLKAPWFGIHNRRPTKHGAGYIELFDDEWLIYQPDILVPVPKVPHPFYEAIDMGDVAEAKSLLAQDVAPAERNTALGAQLWVDNSCMTTTLLQAGVDPNLRDEDGRTPLMESVRIGALRNVKALLAAGADVNAVAKGGATALSIARRHQDQEMIRLLEDASARH